MAENTKKWDETGRRYRSYIKLEKRLSENTVESYMRDYMQFAHFILRQWDVAPHKVEPQMVERYMTWLYERGREKTSQARALSGIKSFFNFLMISDKIESSPAEFFLTPKFGRRLPDVLTTAEIDRIIAAVDTSTVKGLRDCAMLEVLYSCGLRVSELTSLRMQDLFFGEGYIRVIGKGDKQRIVPVSSTARDRIQRYLEERRSVRTGEEIVFLNNRGGQLTRVMVFTVLKQAARRAGDAGARKHPHDRNLHPPRPRTPAAHGRGAFTDITPEIEKSDRRPPLPRPPALFAHPNPPRFSFREEDGVRSARIRQPHNFRICDCGVSRSES